MSRSYKDSWIDTLSNTEPKLKRNRVWCTICGRMQVVDSRECMRHGWPKCCGYTMTIDSPEEREARKP
jgi:hypothetical protein